MAASERRVRGALRVAMVGLTWVCLGCAGELTKSQSYQSVEVDSQPRLPNAPLVRVQPPLIAADQQNDSQPAQPDAGRHAQPDDELSPSESADDEDSQTDAADEPADDPADDSDPGEDNAASEGDESQSQDPADDDESSPQDTPTDVSVDNEDPGTSDDAAQQDPTSDGPTANPTGHGPDLPHGTGEQDAGGANGIPVAPDECPQSGYPPSCPRPVEQILQSQSCALSVCHGTAEAPPLASLDLAFDIGDLAQRLSQTSGTGDCDGKTVLDLADPESSLLVDKLSGDPSCGLAMPPAGFDVRFTDEERTCLVDWVKLQAKCLEDAP